VTRSPLWIATIAVAGVLALWAFGQTLGIPDSRVRAEMLFLLIVAVLLHGVGLGYGPRTARTAGLAGIALVYFVSQFLFLGIALPASLAYVTLLVTYVEVLQITERFVPLLERPHLPEARPRIRGALVRAYLRLAVAAGVALIVALLAADLSGAGTVPTTTIPSALFLAIGFLVVVWLLAVLPILERRAS
jgi:hypothetical protein